MFASMRNSLIILCLILSGCPFPMWPDLPDKGACRNFAMTTWGGGAPWSEVEWGKGKDIVWVDEPMLTQWGWKGDINNPTDVCGPIGIGMVRAKLDKLRVDNPNSKVWINWSLEEWIAIVSFCNEPPGLGADVLSIDSYGGIWDWAPHMQWRLGQIYRLLEPGQQMGLVPEGHRLLGTYLDYEPIDYVMISTLYFDWAMRHDKEGKIYAFAPFYWWTYGDMVGIQDQPQLKTLLENLAVEYPRCAN